MHELTLERGRIKINMIYTLIGDDLFVIISGGDCPHIGCVTLSVPRPSLSDGNIISSTTSVLNLVGHKDDEAARNISHILSSNLNKNVVLTCGIHVDNITKEEIKTVIELLNELLEIMLKKLI